MVMTVDDLHMRYSATDILHDVSFEAHPNKILALLDPNGTDKNTTIKILKNFQLHSNKTINILGTDPTTTDKRWHSQINIVLQS